MTEERKDVIQPNTSIITMSQEDVVTAPIRQESNDNTFTSNAEEYKQGDMVPHVNIRMRPSTTENIQRIIRKRRR